jgi:putative hemolysin
MRVSLINARLSNLMNLRERNPSGVDRTLQLLEKPHLPASVRLASLLNHFLMAGVALLLLIEYTGPQVGLLQMLAVILIFSVIVLIIELALEGGVSPRAEEWSITLTPIAQLVDIVFRPVTWLLMLLLGSATLQRPRAAVTEDELKNWVEDEQNESSLEQGERRMIYSIFQFGDTLCREIMIPRIDVYALDVNTSIPEAIEGALRSGHSRLPVYEEAIDNVIGVLYAKDLLRLSLAGENGNSIRALLRPAYFVPEAKKVDELLRELQERGVHMAIVVDEYGGMAGVVTLEDIVEEIVGDIRDEFDEMEELTYQQVSPDEYCSWAALIWMT